jgi:hypothetical protein
VRTNTSRGQLPSLEAPPVADPLERRPEARSYRVRDLVQFVDEGKIRLPSFQRRLCWGPTDRQLLFDSLYRGYPIGTLLLWEHPAPAGQLVLGPVTRRVSELQDALWVIDGQQRLSTLSACLLLRPDQPGYEDHALFFDLEKREVVGPSRSRTAGPRWLPVHRTLSQPDLSTWVMENGLAGDPVRSALAFKFGDALRDYALPAVIVKTHDERILRQVFERTNTAGKRLRANEVFEALNVGISGERPVSIASFIDELAQLGYGRLEEKHVRYSALVIANQDPTTPTPAKDRRPGALTGAVEGAMEPLRKTLAFLAADAEIPTLALLPYSLPVSALASLFERFPAISERNRQLLVRWVWRGILSGYLRGSSVGDVRALHRVTRRTESESQAVQEMLALAGSDRPATLPTSLEPLNFARATRKVVLTAMMAQEPINLALYLADGTRAIVSASDLTDDGERDESARRSIAGRPTRQEHVLLTGLKAQPMILRPRSAAESGPLTAAIANRLMTPLPDGMDVESVLRVLIDAGAHDVLASHGFDETCISRLRERAPTEQLVSARREALDDRIRVFTERLARWDAGDRPAIEEIFDEVDEDVA